MVRTKILKKKRNTFNRFESDRHIRMGVSFFILKLREAGEDQEVSIVWSEEDLEVPIELLNVVMDQMLSQDICYLTTGKNSSSII